MKPYVEREFLNLLGHGTAFVAASVNQAQYNAELIIGDCNRQITLDFSIWNPEDVANVQHKAQILRRVMNTVLDHVEAMAESHATHQRAKDAAREKRERERALGTSTDW